MTEFSIGLIRFEDLLDLAKQFPGSTREMWSTVNRTPGLWRRMFEEVVAYVHCHEDEYPSPPDTLLITFPHLKNVYLALQRDYVTGIFHFLSVKDWVEHVSTAPVRAHVFRDWRPRPLQPIPENEEARSQAPREPVLPQTAEQLWGYNLALPEVRRNLSDRAMVECNEWIRTRVRDVLYDNDAWAVRRQLISCFAGAIGSTAFEMYILAERETLLRRSDDLLESPKRTHEAIEKLEVVAKDLALKGFVTEKGLRDLHDWLCVLYTEHIQCIKERTPAVLDTEPSVAPSPHVPSKALSSDHFEPIGRPPVGEWPAGYTPLEQHVPRPLNETVETPNQPYLSPGIVPSDIVVPVTDNQSQPRGFPKGFGKVMDIELDLVRDIEIYQSLIFSFRQTVWLFCGIQCMLQGLHAVPMLPAVLVTWFAGSNLKLGQIAGSFSLIWLLALFLFPELNFPFNEIVTHLPIPEFVVAQVAAYRVNFTPDWLPPLFTATAAGGLLSVYIVMLVYRMKVNDLQELASYLR